MTYTPNIKNRKQGSYNARISLDQYNYNFRLHLVSNYKMGYSFNKIKKEE